MSERRFKVGDRVSHRGESAVYTVIDHADYVRRCEARGWTGVAGAHLPGVVYLASSDGRPYISDGDCLLDINRAHEREDYDAAEEAQRAHSVAQQHAVAIDHAEFDCMARLFLGWWRCGNRLCGRCYP